MNAVDAWPTKSKPRAVTLRCGSCGIIAPCAFHPTRETVSLTRGEERGYFYAPDLQRCMDRDGERLADVPLSYWSGCNREELARGLELMERWGEAPERRLPPLTPEMVQRYWTAEL